MGTSPDRTGSKCENRRSSLEIQVPGPEGRPGAQGTGRGVHWQATFRDKKALESRELGAATWSELAQPNWQSKPMAAWLSQSAEQTLAACKAHLGSYQLKQAWPRLGWIFGTEILLAQAWLWKARLSSLPNPRDLAGLS